MTKARTSNGAAKRPSAAVSVPNKPITDEPRTLMTIVPHGKAGPVSATMTVASQARRMLPIAPPRPIKA